MKQRIRILTGISNYLLSLVLVSMPWFLQTEDAIMAKLTLLLIGIASAFVSLVADHELGILKAIRYKEQLMVQIVLGAFLSLSPFIFGFFDSMHRQHFLLGSVLVLFPCLSYRIHFTRQRLRAQYP